MRRISLLALVVCLFAGAAPAAAQLEVSARAADIRIGGRLHSQYATSSVGDYDEHFFFRRVRIIADVTVSDFFDARVQPDFAGGTAELKDAYVRFRFAPAFELTMGQFKRSFDLFELSSSTDLSLVERDGRVGGVTYCAGVGGVCSYSRLTERLRFADRDQGIRAQGSGGRVSYEVSVTNGTGTNVSDENDAKSFSGRMSLAATERVSVSGQVALHDYVDPDGEDEYASAFGVDVQYGTWRDGLLVQAAVVSGENWANLDEDLEASTFVAFQAVASYYAARDGARLSGIEPLLRVSWGDPDFDLDDDGGLVLTPGLMLYVSGKNKIGANVDVWSPQTGDTEYSLKIQSFLYF